MFIALNRIASVVAGLLLSITAAHATQSAAPPKADSHRLVYLIEYVGTDYDRAVRDGNIVDQAEYGEALRLTRQVVHEYHANHPKPDAVAKSLADLETLITDRASSQAVWLASRAVVPLLSQALGATALPIVPPNIANGRRRYTNDCASCHGPTGGGDGPSSGGLQPASTAFRGLFLERLSPRQAYRAVALGVASTAMPSYSDAYTEQELWDVAFFLMTLRVEFEPKRPPASIKFGLEDLATSSNEELLARLRPAHPDATPNWIDYFRLNFSTGEGVAPLAGQGTATTAGLTTAIELQDSFAAVADRLFPRVVGVSSYARAVTAPNPSAGGGTPASGWSHTTEDEPLFPGFRRLRSGSGFLVDDQGYILSCDHLVRDENGTLAEFVSVELHDQRRFVAKIIGAEPSLDLAILHIADPAWTFAEPEPTFADSDRLQAGHWLIALGDPPGPEAVFTVGVVSAGAQRQCYQEQMSATLVQSSLIVPPGGLGGPIVDIFGRVVGLSIGLRQNPSANGLPIGPLTTPILPINLVLNLTEALKVAQSDRSPWIGVSVLELLLLRQQLGAKADSVTIPESGVYIDNVFEPSPATQAGVQKGDFLLALNGHKLGAVGDFQKWLYVLGIDSSVELSLQRDGKPLTLSAKIEARPATATTR